ncbi:MAG: MBL fold metallo-hydrolase [Planctomycetaceae bacterium]|nr:MAG: MBL fold metallo-hydrolase [Planctomycetaceae bacterium]
MELKPGVHWVGVVDWALRHFHGHELSTHRGSAYNAFLIKQEKTVLIDTVWGPFADEFLANLRTLVDPASIDIVVVNHSEPDHSGALPALMELCPNAQVVVSKRGMESVPGHYHKQWNFTPVKTGDRIRIGKDELVFIEATMLHWPDSMFTYLTGANILMPNDAFGQHYATAYRFNDQVDQHELYEEALKYYANILTPFSDQVIRKIDELTAMNLPVDIIAPSHGVMWRTDPMQIVHKYRQWAMQEGKKQAVIVYDSMWHATRRMAEAVGDGLAGEGVPFKLYHIAVSDRNDVLAEIFQSKGLAVGSSTVNRNLLPSLFPILEEIKGLRFKNKTAAAFGSYGWSGECVKLIEEHFGKCNMPLAGAGIAAKWQPTTEDLEKCRNLGKQLAEAIKKA